MFCYRIAAMKRAQAVIEVFLIFLRLGLTSFGGPVAHLGYFQKEFVARRQWLDERTYGDLVSLCQFLPGPASSQLGMAIGLLRAGIPGSIAAWLGFTLPSAIAMVIFALLLPVFDQYASSGWVHGLKIVTVAVVAQAVVVMSRSLCPDRPRLFLALVTAVIVLAIPSIFTQMAVMALGALAGFQFLKSSSEPVRQPIATGVSKRTGTLFLCAFAGLLVGLPAAAALGSQYLIKLIDVFYRAGALVFGGGHVVLPLLQSQIATQGWVLNDVFIAGYGAAQALPGPLFSFAAFIGAVSNQSPSGWMGAMIALTAVFLPGYLLIIGVLPFWESLQRREDVRRAMTGVNASVVGILLAALFNPVMTNAVHSITDLVATVVCYILLKIFSRAPWTVIILLVVSGGIFDRVGY